MTDRLVPAGPANEIRACLIGAGTWAEYGQIAFGGAATRFVTSLSNASGPAREVAQPMMTLLIIWQTRGQP